MLVELINPMPESGPGPDRRHHSVHEPPKAVSPKKPEHPDTEVSLHTSASSALQTVIEADSTTREIVVRMVDPSTGEVVRQMPPEEMLRIARHINGQVAAQQHRNDREQE